MWISLRTIRSFSFTVFYKHTTESKLVHVVRGPSALGEWFYTKAHLSTWCGHCGVYWNHGRAFRYSPGEFWLINESGKIVGYTDNNGAVIPLCPEIYHRKLGGNFPWSHVCVYKFYSYRRLGDGDFLFAYEYTLREQEAQLSQIERSCNAPCRWTCNFLNVIVSHSSSLSHSKLHRWVRHV